MKILISFLLITFFHITPKCCDNTEMYDMAFNYILLDTTFKQSKFGKNLSQENSFISSTIVNIKKIDFARNIAEYEYGLKTNHDIDKFSDSLYTLLIKNYYDTMYCSDMQKLNLSTEKKYKYKFYFSKIDNNQFTVEIFLYNRSLNGYQKAIESSLTMISYYFYLDDSQKIKKVFSSITMY